MVVPLPHLFIYLSPLEFPDLFISSINYFTFSSLSLSLSISLSLTSWTLWPLHLLNKLPHIFIYLSLTLTSWTPSPQLITPWISYLSPMLRFFFSLHVVPIILLLFESQRYIFPLWFLIDFVGFHAFIYLFIYLVFPFCSIFLFFGFWCSLFRWFYNFVVPKLFSSNVLIVVLTSFVFLFILMLYNIRLIRLDIFSVHRMSLQLVLINSDVTLVKVKTYEVNLVVAPQDPSTF